VSCGQPSVGRQAAASEYRCCRAAEPEVLAHAPIILRAGLGFARNVLMQWCEIDRVGSMTAPPVAATHFSVATF
jgi:hypothetical protein